MYVLLKIVQQNSNIFRVEITISKNSKVRKSNFANAWHLIISLRPLKKKAKKTSSITLCILFSSFSSSITCCYILYISIIHTIFTWLCKENHDEHVTKNMISCFSWFFKEIHSIFVFWDSDKMSSINCDCLRACKLFKADLQ